MAKLSKYYQLVGELDGVQSVIYGSFNKADCVDEKQDSIEGLKADGFKKIKIITIETTDKMDKSIYPELVEEVEEVEEEVKTVTLIIFGRATFCEFKLFNKIAKHLLSTDKKTNKVLFKLLFELKKPIDCNKLSEYLNN